MSARPIATRAIMDGNTAAAHVAYRVNEVCAIFPITPSSTMAELADQWASEGLANIWGNIPLVQEMHLSRAAAEESAGRLGLAAQRQARQLAPAGRRGRGRHRPAVAVPGAGRAR